MWPAPPPRAAPAPPLPHLCPLLPTREPLPVPVTPPARDAAPHGAPLCLPPTLQQAKFRSAKFEIRPDEVAQLEADLGALTSPGLRALLFAKVRALLLLLLLLWG